MAIQEGCNSAAEAAKFQAPYTGFGAVSLAQKGGKSRKALKKTRKQKGGAPSWGDFASALSFRPLTASVPPGQMYSTMMNFKGTPSYPSSLPNTGSPPYQDIKPIATVATTGVIVRDLAKEL
jgi:hypothetical protein